MKYFSYLLLFAFSLTAEVSFAQALTNNNRFKGPIPYRDVTAYMPAGGCDNTSSSLFPVQGTINATSTSMTVNSKNNFVNGCGIFIMNAGPKSTLLTPAQGTAPNPVVIGATGATTIHYKVVAIDNGYGLSGASSAITATSAPSTRTSLNYVGIFWQGVANAVGYLVYTDQTGGGTYVPLGYSFDCAGFAAGTVCGAIDKGVETHTWSVYKMWPTTPPASQTNQALITTIASGGGTFYLTLAAAARNSVSKSFTMPDNAPFFKSAISDASNDGGPFDKGTVFIPNGLWFASTLPFPSTGTQGIKFLLSGQLQIFGLPIMGPLSGGAANTGYVSFEGHGGIYHANDWSLSCANIYGYPSLGSVFLVSNGSLDLKNICLTTYEAGIVSAPGSLTTEDVTFANVGSGPDVQIDNNSFFSLFDHTNWNTSTFNPVWLLGLTNNSHSSVFDFRDNSFISHGIRYDQVFPSPGYFGNVVFDGSTNIEDNLDHGFINVTTSTTDLLDTTIDNLTTGDYMVPQSVVYMYNNPNAGMPAINLTIHGQSAGFSALLGSDFNNGNPTNCRAWTYENSNLGSSGMSSESIGYYGNMFGTYSGCDLGITTTGYDVQTTEVLTSGGNDQLGPAGEQMLGHVFRRPQTKLTPNGSGGSLDAGNYYFQVTMLDVAGRESAPSPEVFTTVSGSTSSIAVSAVTQIYFPASCNVYFGPSSGGEANYFNSTSVTNGTCTFTLTTTSGETPKAPQAVGNAMRTWLSEENNAKSCLFCGLSGGLGTGILGFNLTSVQYAAPPTGVQFSFNGGVHSYKFYSASERTAPTGIVSTDLLYADSTAHQWKKIENNGTAFNVTGTLSGTTGSIGGSALTAGHCASGTVSVTGATTSMTVSVSPNTYAGDGFIPWGYVSASGTVTVKVCAQVAGTPTRSTYNVRVIQ